jgi:ABC-type glycerol-3-phosphate transport system substrate-binding protein
MLFKDRSYAQSPGADLGAGDPFYNTKAGMALVCCAALGFVEKIAGFDWAFAPMPRGKVASYDMAPTVMGVAKPSTQREASWEFVKFLNDKANLARAERRMPATLPDLDRWVADTFGRWPDSRAQVLAEGARIARPLDPLRLHPRWAPMSSEILEPAWKDVLDQKLAIPDMIRTVKPLLQRMIDDFERTRRG